MIRRFGFLQAALTALAGCLTAAALGAAISHPHLTTLIITTRH
jgi:hypothetical protein